MIKVYQENIEFGEYTKFDTNTGRLCEINEEVFRSFIPEDKAEYLTSLSGTTQRIDYNGSSVFMGDCVATHTIFPRRIYFQITRDCNLHCDYCFIKAERGHPSVPTDSIMEIASFMGRHGLMEVRMTGGEPTLHPDFFKIIHSFKKNNIYVSIATNGLFKKYILEKLCQEKNIWLICSIDGNRETHNKYRPGTFDIIINNLKYLKKNNPSIRIRLTTVLTKENKDQMFQLGQICKSVGAESITIIPLRPQLRYPAMKSDMISAKMFKQVLEDLLEAKQKLGIQFTTTIETDYVNDIYKDPIFTKRSSCAAGREGTNLDYDFYRNKFIIYGCSYCPASDLKADPKIRTPFLAGEFAPDKVDKFWDIWNDDSRWTLFRDLSLKSNTCKSCEELGKRCTGSCPIQNLDYSILDIDSEIKSQLAEQMKKTSEWYCYKNFVYE